MDQNGTFQASPPAEEYEIENEWDASESAATA